MTLNEINEERVASGQMNRKFRRPAWPKGQRVAFANNEPLEKLLLQYGFQVWYGKDDHGEYITASVTLADALADDWEFVPACPTCGNEF